MLLCNWCCSGGLQNEQKATVKLWQTFTAVFPEALALIYTLFYMRLGQLELPKHVLLASWEQLCPFNMRKLIKALKTNIKKKKLW